MKVAKWVDFRCEVDVEFSIEDIQGVLAECFSCVTYDPLGEPPPSWRDVMRAFNQIHKFLTALTDEQIALLESSQRSIIKGFMTKHAARFKTDTKCPDCDRHTSGQHTADCRALREF